MSYVEEVLSRSKLSMLLGFLKLRLRMSLKIYYFYFFNIFNILNYVQTQTHTIIY